MKTFCFVYFVISQQICLNKLKDCAIFILQLLFTVNKRFFDFVLCFMLTRDSCMELNGDKVNASVVYTKYGFKKMVVGLFSALRKFCEQLTPKQCSWPP